MKDVATVETGLMAEIELSAPELDKTSGLFIATHLVSSNSNAPMYSPVPTVYPVLQSMTPTDAFRTFSTPNPQ